MGDDARLQELLAAACLRADAEEAMTRDLRGFLEASGLDAEDVEALAASPRRLALYRRLVRNNLTGVTEKMLARTKARLNALAGAFDASFSAFLDARGPRTPYLRDVPGEFLDWAAPRWAADSSLPPWAGDSARHELIEFQLGAAIAPSPPAFAEVALDRGLVLRGPVRLMRYEFAVHDLPADVDDRSEPRREPTALLAYRTPEHEVCFLKLPPFLAALTEHLLAGTALGTAVQRAAAEHGAGGADALLAAVARYLADLGDRGILLGGEAHSAAEVAGKARS